MKFLALVLIVCPFQIMRAQSPTLDPKELGLFLHETEMLLRELEMRIFGQSEDLDPSPVLNDLDNLPQLEDKFQKLKKKIMKLDRVIDDYLKMLKNAGDVVDAALIRDGFKRLKTNMKDAEDFYEMLVKKKMEEDKTMTEKPESNDEDMMGMPGVPSMPGTDAEKMQDSEMPTMKPGMDGIDMDSSIPGGDLGLPSESEKMPDTEMMPDIDETDVDKKPEKEEMPPEFAGASTT